MPEKGKKSGLDVGYLRVAASNSLASSIFTVGVQEEEQRIVQEKLPQQIAIDLLHDNPYQPRTTMEEESLQQLAETIASQGFQGVLVARPHPQQLGAYQLTAGHRRREAAKRAGLRELPVIVHNWSDQDMAALSATENIQREDLSPLEEGRLFQLMIDQLGLTQMEVAGAVKKDRGYVRNRLRLARAPEDIQAFVREKEDSMRAVVYLLEIEDPAERAPVIAQLLQRSLTTEDLPAYIEELKRRKQAPPAPPAPPSPLASSGSPALSARPTAVPASGIEAPASAPSADVPMLEPTQPDRVWPTEQPASARPQPALPGPHPSSGGAVPSAPPAEQKTPRVREVKLKTILRYLNDYQQSLSEQAPPSADERALLQRIITIARTLLADD